MDVKEMLSGGKRNSPGRAREVAAQIVEDPEVFAECFECVWSSDLILRMRAMHAIRYVAEQCTELLFPVKGQLLDKISKIEQWEVRESFCILLPKLNLTPREIDKAISICRGFLQDRSSIVRTCAMQALTDLALQDPKHLESVYEIVDKCTQTGSKAMAARGRKLLKTLQKELGDE